MDCTETNVNTIKPLQTSKTSNIGAHKYTPTLANDRKMDTYASETNENSSVPYVSDFEIQSATENAKKKDFRQRIRNLRETWEDGSLLASTEDLLDNEDDDGFILASRVKKGKKIKLPKLTSLPDDNSNSIPARNTFTGGDDTKLTCIPDSDMKMSKFNQPSPDVNKHTNQNLNDLSCEEVVSRIKALKQKLDHPKEMNSESKKEDRKPAWCNKTRSIEKRVLDFNECSICYQPWTKDKVILEECGHCFHSECIRLWMKQKNTCPFCATFSLLLDEFPKLA